MPTIIDDTECGRNLISKVQLHSSIKKWDGKFIPAPPYDQRLPNILQNVNKPKYGLWTSSEREDGRSSWLDICENLDINCKPVESHRFQVSGEPRILVLRRQQQIIDLALKWNFVWSELADVRYGDDEWRDWVGDTQFGETVDQYIERKLDIFLDTGEFWGTVADHYDAIHTPYEASFQEKWINTFEVESTFWYEPEKFLKHLGKVAA